MRRRRSGFTLVELLVVILVGSILTGIAVAGGGRFVARQGAVNARDAFVFLSFRARSIAVESGRDILLELDPVSGEAWIVRREGGQRLETHRYEGEYQAEVVTPGNARITICYSPRGYAIPACSQNTNNVEVGFVRGGNTARAVVRPLGQVEAR